MRDPGRPGSLPDGAADDISHQLGRDALAGSSLGVGGGARSHRRPPPWGGGTRWERPPAGARPQQNLRQTRLSAPGVWRQTLPRAPSPGRALAPPVRSGAPSTSLPGRAPVCRRILCIWALQLRILPFWTGRAAVGYCAPRPRLRWSSTRTIPSYLAAAAVLWVGGPVCKRTDCIWTLLAEVGCILRPPRLTD